MYSNDIQWLSQTIFSHKDKEYGTGGFMRVSMSTQTKDSQSFSAPNFVINIQNEGINKTVSLPYQKIFELYGRLQEVVKEAAEEYSSKSGTPDAQLHFKTGKSVYLTFEFMRGTHENEPVVRITISHGTSDSTKVIMPFSPEFHSFISLIGDMIGHRKYLDWCLHFPNRFFMVEMNEVIKQIPGLIKTSVAQMDNPISPPPTDQTPEVDPTSTTEAANMMTELDAFVGDGMKNIELNIPVKLEIADKPKEPKQEKNKMISCLGGDARNFENMIMRCSEKINPIRQVEKEINESYETMECFPGIKDEEMKSIIYLSGREFFIYNSQANLGSVKRSFSVNRYDGSKHAKSANMELAHDLLVMTIFFKLLRDKLEEKTKDNYTNKTMMNIAISLNVFPFVFSFITSDSYLKTIVKEKFALMDSNGMFDSYKEKEFKEYGIEITERDMVDSVEFISENYLKSKSYMVNSYMRQVSLYNGNSCILNPDTQLNEEQIINEVVPFEMYLITNNKSLKDDKKDIIEHARNINMDSAVLAEFIKIASKKNIPIVKFFEDHVAEIPEDVRKEFMKTLGDYNDRDYDLSDNEFPYDSFGEEAVKALFLWKPQTGEKYRTYNKFYKAIVSSVHDKQTILSMITHDDAGNESFADFYSNAHGKGK